MGGLTLERLVNDSIVQPAGHTIALGGLIGSWAHQWSEPVTVVVTMLAGLWYVVSLWETKTCKDMVARFKARQRARHADKHRKHDLRNQ